MNQTVQRASCNLDRAFAALSEATRRGVEEQLAHVDASITDLAGRFDMTLTGMKKRRRRPGADGARLHGEGRACANLQARQVVFEEEAMWIERYRRLWEERLDELDKVVEQLTLEGRVHGRRKSPSATLEEESNVVGAQVRT